LPIGLIVLADASRQKINSSADVTREVGADVFGVVPLVPARALRQIALGDDGNPWRMAVGEAVDGIAARLLYVTRQEPTQVIMVSSALGGEGKTLLATQLATSLARTGHKTLLIDFDTRRPSVERTFQMSLQPGVCETLRGECAAADAVRASGAPNLSVMTAGQWDPQVMTMLASGVMDSLFATLRGQFQFIVIDSCPVLPVADSRFVAQHVDGVLLTVLRDVSRAPKVRAACRILASLGARVLGTVVAEPSAGESMNGYYHAVRAANGKVGV
jgi:capsular exopolysaccharide synthesis family protein